LVTYHERTINLDGKSNVNALRALREKRLLDYLLSTDAEFLVDGWGQFFIERDGEILASSPRFREEYELVMGGPFIWRRRR